MLTENAMRERKWGRYPALRKALENTRISDSNYGPTSASDNMFDRMHRVLEIAILVSEKSEEIVDTTKSMGEEEQMLNDLRELERDLRENSEIFLKMKREIQYIYPLLEDLRRRRAECLFCRPPKERIIAANEYAFAIRDKFPVTELHSLIIPKRHVGDYFDLNNEVSIACDSLMRDVREEILATDETVEGFNLGINSGDVAGQTIFHCHIHLIPRRKGDIDNPRGGVRNVIPEKGDY